jgi:hypothetical protein
MAFTTVASASALSRESADFIFPRVAHAQAIASVLTSIFGGEYSDEQRPDSGAVFLSLGRVSLLLHECVARIDEPGIGQPPVTCQTDPWRRDIDQATALVDVIDALGWADEYEITRHDDVMSDYLGAVEEAIRRARNGLEEESHG